MPGSVLGERERSTDDRRTVKRTGGADVTTTLAGIPIFRHLRQAHLATIASIGATQIFEPGAMLVRRGEPFPGLGIVLTGQLVLQIGDAETILGPGAHFGELAAVELDLTPGDLRAVEPTEIKVIRAHDMYAVFRLDPDIAVTILRNVSRRVHDMRQAADGGEPSVIEDLQRQIIQYAQDFQLIFESERTRTRELQDAVLSTVRILTRVVEKRVPGALSHGVRVGKCAQAVARNLSLSEEICTQAMLAGVLHDIGLIDLGMSFRSIVSGPMDRETLRLLRLHPEAGARLLDDSGPLLGLVPYIINHHEYLDGTGYPNRLVGSAVPTEGRIMAVAEAFEEVLAATQGDDRLRSAYESVQQQARIKFDGECVQALRRAIMAREITV